MRKIITIVGARPQIIKAAALSRAFKMHPKFKEIIVHTGQHYDFNMSEVFFEELNIPKPNYQFEIQGGEQGNQTAQMLVNIEKVLLDEKPDLVVVYGDTNSTLAGALAASKLQIPVVHIEAGMRSFNKAMPEEVNRIITDHCSTLLFSPTKTGIKNLEKEGFSVKHIGHISIDNPLVYHCGDIMLDNSLYFSTIAAQKSKILTQHKLEKNRFILSTVHRNTTTDDPIRLTSLIESLLNLATKHNETIVFPLHPRTLKQLNLNQSKELYQRLQATKNILLTEPLTYLDMIQLEQNAKLILTDSGGVQKEAFYFQKPCIIARPETEWEELVELKTAILCDVEKQKIEAAYLSFISNPPQNYPPIFGHGKAAEFIAEEIVKFLS
ncbi:MAG: UDP-N-acetylglucosamine 2-epimerase (non-hydrolyzing) [Bacteroidales bacterium]|jgi:UDP-GlcNAc3NAcA epimerase|nr:UDP-N-acetylglucosamine 2-epimerase (non-hydrolyzing) [Bacteroidales bacterium]